ncbi:MAG TPA: hypothetical protein V6C78_24025 [Crinalium sp.]|jgi:hypothetical protein
MHCQICLLECALAELFAQVSHSGQITLADRYGLLAAVLDESLSDEERRSVDRLLHAVCKGRVRVVSEISSLV